MSRLVGWLTLFLIGTDLFVLSPLLPVISEGFGVRASAAGWAVTTFAVAYLLGGPSCGALADRVGRYRVLGIGLAVFGLANLATAVAPSLWVLLLARAIAGLAASGITPSVYTLVSATAPAAKRASWLSAVTSGLLLALTSGAPAGSLLATAVGWRGVFVVLAVASLAMLLVSRRGARDQPSTPPPVAEEQPALATRVRALSVTTLWALAVYGLYTYLGTVLELTTRLSPALVAAALVCYGVGAVLGNLVGGRLADRHGGRAASLASLLALALVLGGIGLVVHGPVPLLLGGLVLTGLAAYPYFSAQQVRLVARFPTASSSILAWNNSAMYAGILLGSAAGGVVLSRLGASALAWCCAVVALLGALAAANRHH